MDKELCVVIGAGSGVSLGVARRFGKEGFRIALIARRAESVKESVSELEKLGIKAFGFVADASDFNALKQTFELISQSLGETAVLVYNAAAIKQGIPSEIPVESLVEDFKTNVAGALVAAQAVIPSMRAKGKGTILFTGGGLALHPNPQVASLSVGKAAIRNLAYSLGAELELEGIQVATVTIAGYVKPGTHFDPDLIAETYWQLHTQKTGERQREIVYK